MAAGGERGVVGERFFGRFVHAGCVTGRTHAPRPLVGAREPGLARGEGGGRHALEQFASGRGHGDAVHVPIARFEHHDIAGRDQRQTEPPRGRDTLAQGTPARGPTLGGDPTYAQPEPARARAAPRRTGVQAGGGRHPRHLQCCGESRRLDHDVQSGVQLGERAHEIEIGVELPCREHGAQVGVTAPVERDEQRAGTPPRDSGLCRADGGARCIAQRHLGAEQRRESRRARGAVERQGEVEVVAVRERQGVVAQRQGPLDQDLWRRGSAQQRTARAHAQRDEGHDAPRHFVSEGVRSTKPCSSSASRPFR